MILYFGVASWNGKFHLSPNENIFTIALINIHYLYTIKADETMNFDEFLEKLELSEQQYLKAIRLSLTHNTLLLKRSPAEIRINCYNPNLLKAWKANMDIQFVSYHISQKVKEE